jgi:hypothetical protein
MNPNMNAGPRQWPSDSYDYSAIRVVTSDVFRENHVRGTSSGRVRTSPCPDERSSRPTAGGRPLVDGIGGRPKRTASPAAERTATLQQNSQEHQFSFIELIHWNTSFRFVIVIPLFSYANPEIQ